jgi:hypothetical protein
MSSDAATVDRVQWFRDKAQMEHWEDELEITEEEFRRTIRAYATMSEMWTSLADHPGPVKGFAAYAFKQADMYREMSDDCRKKFGAAKGTWPDECTLSEHISRQRQERVL